MVSRDASLRAERGPHPVPWIYRARGILSALRSKTHAPADRLTLHGVAVAKSADFLLEAGDPRAQGGDLVPEVVHQVSLLHDAVVFGRCLAHRVFELLGLPRLLEKAEDVAMVDGRD